jgi:hypothetical protein
MGGGVAAVPSKATDAGQGVDLENLNFEMLLR